MTRFCVQVLECHVFICKSVEAATTLVSSTSYAFEQRLGWLPEGASPPPAIGSSMTFGRSALSSLHSGSVTTSTIGDQGSAGQSPSGVQPR